MFRDLRVFRGLLPSLGFLAMVLAAPAPAPAQEQQRRARIDVQDYTIDAEISPTAQTLTAKAAVRFTAVDDNIATAGFELNNALNVSRVEDAAGKPIEMTRNQQDFSVRLTFQPPLPKGQTFTAIFSYDGRLTGAEESPVYGIRFAAIHPDFAYLLYPSRWFPVLGYTTGRFAADIRVTVPAGYTVAGSGIDSRSAAGDKTVFEFKMTRASFPGSIAVMKDPPVKAQEGGVTTTVYFRQPENDFAQQYGQEVGKAMTHFTSLFGLPPYADLTVIETEAGAPNGYAAPGMIFLSPRGITRQVSSRLVANEVARQWWEELISPTTRNHLWIENGLAAYSELLWTEHEVGAGAMESQLQTLRVEALTVDTVPVIQSSRLEDYSPEMWALTGSKGAVVAQMLRYVVGDDAFFKILKTFAQQNAWKSVNTDDLRQVADAVTGNKMDYFFIQWIESSGVPEFKLDYTVYRLGGAGQEKKGFRVMGKIGQDVDTFRMPVELKIETEGDPEFQRVEVAGTSSEFSVDSFGKPKTISIDPNGKLLRYSPQIRVAVAIRRGEQYAELSEFVDAIKEYQKALETTRNSSLAHYRIGEVYFLQGNWWPAANEFRAALDGNLEPKWTEVWSHINLGKIYDVSGQRDRAVNEYNQAIRTKDNTQGAQEEAARYLKTAYERQRRTDQ
ncbi:MAG TPA: M1 family aminopeptidase [Bryobacteraceae bacterium]|nr:M1 family aminopeptidase [Bryobacteraceae bacterium]